MKATAEEINSVQRRVRLEVPAEIVDKAFAAAYSKQQRKASIKGFRPGKAPLSMIRRLYQESVIPEVGQELAKKAVIEYLREVNLDLIAQPVLESPPLPVQGQDFAVVMLCDIRPEIKVPSFRGLTLKSAGREVTAADVDRVISSFRHDQAKRRELEGETPIGPEHVVNFSQKASYQGQELPDFAMPEFTARLSEEGYWPEGKAALLGHKVGEVVEVATTLPADHHVVELQNTTIQVSLTILSVSEEILPALDEELARDAGFASLEELRVDTEKRLVERIAEQEQANLIQQACDYVRQTFPFDVPPSLVDVAIDGYIEDMRWDTEEQRRHALHDPSLRERFLEPAKIRTANGLILAELVRREGLQVTEAEIEARIQQLLTQMSGAGSEFARHLRTSYRNRLVEELLMAKARKFIVEHATLTSAS